MLQRLITLFTLSIAVCIVLGFIRSIFFSDIVPIAWNEDQPFWRLETAVLLMTLQWITGVVGLLSAAGIAAMRLHTSRSPH